MPGLFRTRASELLDGRVAGQAEVVEVVPAGFRHSAYRVESALGCEDGDLFVGHGLLGRAEDVDHDLALLALEAERAGCGQAVLAELDGDGLGGGWDREKVAVRLRGGGGFGRDVRFHFHSPCLCSNIINLRISYNIPQQLYNEKWASESPTPGPGRHTLNESMRFTHSAYLNRLFL